MAKKLTKKQKAELRKKLEESLKTALAEKKLDESFYSEHLAQYMVFYDAFQHLNELKLTIEKNKDTGYRAYVDITAEMRRISGQMEALLKFLGMQPPEKTGGGYAPL